MSLENKDKKNVLIFLIDALRYDILSDDKQRELLTPCINELLKDGFFNKITANSATTQFVLPSLLSQTYPLDYGGYDTGIRHRPKSFIEIFKDNGYFTYLATSCNQYGLAHDYDRGFDSIRGLYSYSGLIRRLVYRKLKYEIDLWREGEKSKEELVDVIKSELGILLNKINNSKNKSSNLSFLWKYADLHNKNIIKKCEKELELLESNPDLVINKLEVLTGLYYWTSLGNKLSKWERFKAKILSFVITKIDNMTNYLGINIAKYGAFQFPVEEVTRDFPNIIGKDKLPWLAYIHVMDVHSYFFFRGIADYLLKLRFLPRLLKMRRLCNVKRPFLHDLCLMQSDYALSKIVKYLKSIDQFDNTVFMIMGDHGKYLPQVDPRNKTDVNMRSHKEHIETIMMVSGAGNIPNKNNLLLDSMSVSATLLDIVNLNNHESFKGISAYSGGREFVVIENAGRGSADLERKDLFFTITDNAFKLMLKLKAKEVEPIALYDLNDDSSELKNIVNEDRVKDIVSVMMNVVIKEREALFSKRGIKSYSS